jgi:hypothetical protein
VTRPDDEPALPDVTSDEQDVGWGDERGDDNEQRLLDERPPHHEDRD